MFCLKSKLKVDDVRIIEADHDVSFVGDNTLFPALEKSLFFHQLQCIKSTSGLEPGQKDPTETSSSNALDNLEILELDIIVKLLSPDGFDFKQLPLEYFDRLASLEIVVLEDISSPAGLPIIDTRGTKIVVA